MMAPDGGGMMKGGVNGGAPSRSGGGRQVLKKGPWTAAEDAVLMEYVKKHGEGHWNAVQRNSGLMRCGKSCRLRWANHLRPNLRKGAFSPDEERLIVELHSKLGNKWARMAAQLPGRTDNEIKNYWNTRLKRRQRAGLPIYPQEIQPQNGYNNPNLLLMQHTTRSSRSSSPLSALLSGPPPPKPAAYNPPPAMFDSPAAPTAALQAHNSRFNFFTVPPAGNLALTLSGCTNKPHRFSSPFGHPALPIPSLPFGGLHSGPPPFAGGVFGAAMQERPSIQTAATPTTSSGITGGLYPAPSDDASDYEVIPGLSRSNSGLLEDLLHESHALTRDVDKTNDEKKSEDFMEDDHTRPTQDVHEEVVLSFGYEGEQVSGQKETSSGGVDDDILSLLDNFPLAVPVPDWYEDGGKGDVANEQPLDMVYGDAASVDRNHNQNQN